MNHAIFANLTLTLKVNLNNIERYLINLHCKVFFNAIFKYD